MNDIINSVNEILARIDDYKKHFFNSKECRILLDELYVSVLNISSLVGEGEDVTELKKRLEESEKHRNEVQNQSYHIGNEMTNYMGTVNSLQNTSNDLMVNLNDIEDTDKIISNRLQLLLTETRDKGDELKQIDVTILDEILEAETNQVARIDTLNNNIEKLDIDTIKENVFELERKDVELQGKVDANLILHTEVIDDLVIEIDSINASLTNIRKGIEDLAANDAEIEQNINTAENNLNTKVNDLKTEDTRVSNELTRISTLLTDLNNKVLVSSKTAETNKVPIGLKDGFIDNSWLDI